MAFRAHARPLAFGLPPCLATWETFQSGDPDKCDIWGNTPLHLAAANGHLNCLSFLVSFGANVWCLDNDYHTPLDMAAIRSHMLSVRYLDSVAARQSTLNPKLVKKLKERAFHNAEQRIKHCAEIQHQNQRHLEKQFLKETMESGMYDPKSFSSYKQSLSCKIPHCSSIHSSSTYTQAMLNTMIRGRTKSHRTFKISEDGRKSVRSLSGLQLGNDVMFLKQETYSGHCQRVHVRNMFPQNNVVDKVSRAVSDPGLFNAALSKISHNSDSLFSRPGLGTLIFRRSYDWDLVSGSYSASSSKTTAKELSDQLRRHLRPRSPSLDSISTASLQNRDLQDHLWDDTEYEEEEDFQPSSSPLEVFLESHGLSELHSICLQQKMDLDALMLCSESDLAIIGISLGPRKKLLEACTRRIFTLQRARPMQDTQF